MTPKARLTIYERLGLLVCLSACALLGGAVLQHFSRLPRPYTWFEPFWTLRSVIGQPHFPLAVLAVYALGAWTWRGAWDVERSARSLARRLPAREWLPLVKRPLCSIGLVLLIDGVVLGSERDIVDLAALVGTGFALARYRPDRRRLLQDLGYASLSALVFLIICYGYTISKALTFSSGRQFDSAILRLETSWFGAPPHRALALWTSAHPAFAELFDWVYFHFFEHMALTTVLLVAMRRAGQRTEYLGALALCYLLGGPLYQLFPAQGPSFFDPSYFEFLRNSRLTTSSIRSYLQENTALALAGTATEVRTWGYIACMPSLHVAQELVMLYYARACTPAFWLSFLFTALTLLAVVALGWHYPLDSLAGAAVAVTAIAIARWQRASLLPSALGSARDLEPPVAKPVIAPFVRTYFAARGGGPASEP